MLSRISILAAIIISLIASPSYAKQGGDMELGRAAQRQGDYDQAVNSYANALVSGSLSTEDQASTFFHRANIYNLQGKYESAIQDYNEVIKLEPAFVKAYAGRGAAHESQNEFTQAMEDFDQAIKISPDFGPAYYGRGHINFALGKYSTAASDFETNLKLDPTHAYGALWLHIDKVKSGLDDKKEFKRNAANLDRLKWPGPIISHYLGQASEEEVQQAAMQVPNTLTQNRICEFNYYIGEYKLMQKQKNEAKTMLHQAAELCPTGFFERIAANAELQRFTK